MTNMNIDEMDEGKDKEIMKAIGSDLKPYVKKSDGFAKKIEEDIEVKYKDYDGHENVLKIPAGSIVKVMDGCRTEIVTEDDFNKKYVFHDEGEEVEEEKEEESHKEVPKQGKKLLVMGIESLK